ncbi:MAG TPA: alpha/beta hydrolase [Pseudonocardia sp.]|uniref:alpha/beta fold hydrolase n=1 Tax=Pseudonocardia sp. TaxID=60912 RepID=UPI002ED90781
MIPSYEEVRESCDDVTLDGLPACHPWSALLEIGDLAFGVRVEDGQLTFLGDVTINSSWDFSFSISEAEWSEFRALPVRRGHTSAQALVATAGAHRVRGSREVWARAAGALDRIVEAIRARGQDPHPVRPEPAQAPLGLSPIEGRYLHVEVENQVQRIYLEWAGEGVPLLCLHTAGADSRQFRHLLEDPELTARYRVIAFDMPWHGRSDPPDDWQRRRYALTTETYAATVLAVMEALRLSRPVLMGCSMGGALALYLASRHGDRFTGVCALEGGLGNPGRFVDWTHRADVDHSAFLTSWVGGLIAPGSPAGPRAQTLWGYAQSGPGVYQGDTYFYSRDLPLHTQELGPAGCPLFVFSGEYDYSATTEMSREAAARLGGQLIKMPGRGHFPMSEDPVGFAEHLFPVLDLLHGKYQS